MYYLLLQPELRVQLIATDVYLVCAEGDRKRLEPQSLTFKEYRIISRALRCEVVRSGNDMLLKPNTTEN